MKLLLDANVSWRVVKKVSHLFPECIHVSKTGLIVPADDVDIWRWAKLNGYDLILSNDSDFEQLLTLRGHPPKVILLRMGNQSTQSVVATLQLYFEEIAALHQDPYLGFVGNFLNYYIPSLSNYHIPHA